ncbi:hypothetical protein [Bradyrhizobium sp. 174]|uniref:hypothetical protein n=1 Tax=Bradyrhizobium sp. 174 TaxID=2782645 RepID=UPI001FF95D53|nr:hypothetical protein [Bradyrhizobium sp. 174]MCK1577864.1 hypothetical protein [Bradyrhizobium sp. 174]
MISVVTGTIFVFLAGGFGFVICGLINANEKQALRERCGELENALDDAGRTLLCHGYRHAAQQAMKALGRPVLETTLRDRSVLRRDGAAS